MAKEKSDLATKRELAAMGKMLHALINIQDVRQNAADASIYAMAAQINNLARQLADLQRASAGHLS